MVYFISRELKKHIYIYTFIEIQFFILNCTEYRDIRFHINVNNHYDNQLSIILQQGLQIIGKRFIKLSSEFEYQFLVYQNNDRW